MSFEQPTDRTFLAEILADIENTKSIHLHDTDETMMVDYANASTGDLYYDELQNFLNKIAEQEGITDKEALIVALKKYSEETTDENKKDMAAMLLEEYL